MSDRNQTFDIPGMRPALVTGWAAQEITKFLVAVVAVLSLWLLEVPLLTIVDHLVSVASHSGLRFDAAALVSVATWLATTLVLVVVGAMRWAVGTRPVSPMTVLLVGLVCAYVVSWVLMWATS